MRKTVIDNVTIAASGTYTSDAVPTIIWNGAASLQIALSGSGTATFGYKASNDGVNYLTPVGASAIYTGVTSSSGESGKLIKQFDVQYAEFIKIYCTETGGSSSVTVTATLGMGRDRPA